MRHSRQTTPSVLLIDKSMTIAELYPLHHADMDTQHARIDSLIEDLARILSSSTQAETERFFHSLVQYAKLHFADEEQFMKSCGYPELSVHEADHARLAEQLDAMALHLRKSDSSAALKDFIQSFQDWLRSHTEKVDAAYRDFCEQNPHQQVMFGGFKLE